MGDVPSERFTGTRATPTSVKLLVAGGAGVGKSALVSAISEITPLRVIEEIDDDPEHLGGNPGVRTAVVTTEAVDFGRITIDEALTLYIFDTPEQNRPWSLRDEVTTGALGAVILTDPRRLDECAPAVAYFQRRGTPYIVAVNDAPYYPDRASLASIRSKLRVTNHAPVTHCDPSKRESVKNVLITLLEYAKAQALIASSPLGVPSPN